jgi:malonyl-CoA/methylmalonyl-CoA synthetase
VRASLGAGTIAEAFHAAALAGGDRPALTVDGSARTHAELDAGAGRFATLLRESGVTPGDAILLSVPSSIGTVEAYLGALRAGAVVVLANPSYTEGELRYLAEHSGAVAAVASGAVGARLGGLVRTVVDAEADAASGLDSMPVDPVVAQRAGLLAYTSGTTGRPKGVPLDHANVLANMRGIMRAWRWSADDVLVHGLPLFHQHGLGGVGASLLAGGRAVLHSRFDPEAICAAIAAERATVFLAVPAMYERLVGWDGFASADLSSLRLLVSGSAPLSPALARRVEAVVGALPLERYGTTESGLNVSNLYDGPRKPGAVGIPLPGVEMAVVDDAGHPVADDTDGEIVVRGPQVFAGYRGDAEATAEAFFAGGWFRTGDIGRIDPADGFLSITGRAKDLIISGGMNVYPREVELALEEAEAVTRAAVVGIPSARWGEAVVAAVVPAPGATLDEEALLAFAGERLAPYKRPKQVVAVQELPLNHMGKVLTAEVVELFAGQDDAEEEEATLSAHQRLLERAAAEVAAAAARAPAVEPRLDPPPCP